MSMRGSHCWFWAAVAALIACRGDDGIVAPIPDPGAAGVAGSGEGGSRPTSRAGEAGRADAAGGTPAAGGAVATGGATGGSSTGGELRDAGAPPSDASPAAPADAVVVYPTPAGAKAATEYRVKVGGQPVFVHDYDRTPFASSQHPDRSPAVFAILSMAGGADVEIETTLPLRSARVRPMNLGIVPVIKGQTIRFRLPRPAHVSVELNDDIRVRHLFLFANPLEREVPPAGPSVRTFAAGQVHEAGLITMKDGETIYIPGGAVVKGSIKIGAAKGARILGRGVLDATTTTESPLFAWGARDAVVDGITVVGNASWTFVVTLSDGVTVRNLKQVCWGNNSDGIDINGSRNVLVEDSFLRNHDDNIAIKSNNYTNRASVENVTVRRSTFWNDTWGNALEIGFETQTSSISKVLFEDLDIIHVEEGAAFSIHLGDAATVEGVTYRNVRVEDARVKLVDMYIQQTRYSRDAERGRIRNVRFEGIRIVDETMPPSQLAGFDATHDVAGVAFHNLCDKGTLIDSATKARLTTNAFVSNVTFTGSGCGSASR